MSKIARKFQVGAAACAMVAAATLTPAVAHAAPVVAPPMVVGQSLNADNILPAPWSTKPPNPFFQNSAWWFGRPNPDPPPTDAIFVFNTISLVPGFLKPLYSWFTQNLNFEACVFGISVKLGPYGTVTTSIGQGC